MIELNFDFSTVGGVANIYAIPLSSYSGVSMNYATGNRYLTLLNTTGVIKIPRFADETFSFEETHGRDEHGDYWDPLVRGVIPNASLDNASVIEELERGEWIVLTVDHNGAVRVCGDGDTRLSFSTTASTGSTYADRNHTAFELRGRLGHPSWVVVDTDILT